MLERDRYPPGVPCWIDTEQRDPQRAADFYGGLFGWEFHNRMPADSDPYLVATLRGRPVAAVARLANDASSPTWTTYISVTSAHEAAATVTDAGGDVVRAPFDLLDLGRSATVTDPTGALFRVWEPRTHHGAELVNEPSTWNFSELHTPDPAQAKAFYGAVFGWEASGFGAEGGDFGFWRLPGYGDFLAQRDPDVRSGQEDVGAPKGFEDAVAWLVPTTAEQSGDDAPPHWSITFAVDDADAVADRAEHLGGRVLVPPADAPWVRTTVVSDPEGAVFTASKFTPPV